MSRKMCCTDRQRGVANIGWPQFGSSHKRSCPRGHRTSGPSIAKRKLKKQIAYENYRFTMQQTLRSE